MQSEGEEGQRERKSTAGSRRDLSVQEQKVVMCPSVSRTCHFSSASLFHTSYLHNFLKPQIYTNIIKATFYMCPN